AGATVTVRRSLYGDPERKQDDMIVQETKHTTDADGKYSFVIPPEQSSQRYLYIELDVEHPDYAPQKNFGYALSMIRKNEKRGDLGSFTLRTGPRLRGKVLDAKGNPMAGVNVNAESQDRNEEITEPVADSINRSAVTNEKGEFEMNPLPPGQYLVKPDQHPRDSSLDRKDRKDTPVPAVFVGTKVVLKDGANPDPVEVRAVPHVVVEAQYYDSGGKPTRGHSCFVFGR